MLTKKEQKLLLELARKAIINTCNGDSPPNFKNPPKILKEMHGIFVSVYVGSRLRGCIGDLLPNNTVYNSIIENSINAAYHDYRFPPLSKNEFGKLRIEVSLLTDPVMLNLIDFNHLLSKLNFDEGLILKKGLKMATFLPQVWKQIKDKEEFLTHLCSKANLYPEEWKSSDVEIYAYKVTKFRG